MPKPKFNKSMIEAAKLAAQYGATDREIAESFEVSERTINRWKSEHPEFGESLKVGKAAADDRVEMSLYRRAVGYTYDSKKVFMPAGHTEPVIVDTVEHVAPDPRAGIFWLKNRRKDDWRDRHEVAVEEKVDLAAAINRARKRVGKSPLPNRGEA